MGAEKFVDAELPAVALPKPVAVGRMYLRICVEIADALNITNYTLLSRCFPGEVRERLRCVALKVQLCGLVHATRVIIVLLIFPMQQGLDVVQRSAVTMKQLDHERHDESNRLRRPPRIERFCQRGRNHLQVCCSVGGGERETQRRYVARESKQRRARVGLGNDLLGSRPLDSTTPVASFRNSVRNSAS